MLIWDLETNGLLDTVSKIHCMVIYDTYSKMYFRYRPETIADGAHKLYDHLSNGGQICGQNIINFDLPVLNMFYPWFKVTREMRHNVIDTLVLARLVFSEINYIDNKLLSI